MWLNNRGFTVVCTFILIIKLCMFFIFYYYLFCYTLTEHYSIALEVDFEQNVLSDVSLIVKLKNYYYIMANWN